MIIIELKTWSENDINDIDFFYASFKNLKEVKKFLIDDRNNPYFKEWAGDDYREKVTNIIYVCGYEKEEYVDSDSAEEIYKNYIKRIFS